MSPEESGTWLLDRMRQQIGFENYADKKLLDFGCGVRFSQAFINNKLTVGRYVGVDVYQAMIKFLRKHVRNDRFEYVYLNAFHPLYNPTGIALSPDTRLQLEKTDFDLACMFSVITHQYPNDSQSIFTILRRHLDIGGYLFFTCFLDDSIVTFEDRSPERNGGFCFYNSTFLIELVESCGWRLVARAPAKGSIIGDSLIFQPAKMSDML